MTSTSPSLILDVPSNISGELTSIHITWLSGVNDSPQIKSSIDIPSLFWKSSDEDKEEITLEVNEKNTEAINLYSKKEFKIVGNRKKYYDSKYDAIIMTKKLKNV